MYTSKAPSSASVPSKQEHVAKKEYSKHIQSTGADLFRPQEQIRKRQLQTIDSKNIPPCKISAPRSQTKHSMYTSMRDIACGQEQPRKRPTDSVELKSIASCSLNTQASETKQSNKPANTPPSRLETQRTHSKQSFSPTSRQTTTILDLCTQQNGSVFEGDVLVVYGPATNKSPNAQKKAKIVHVDLVDSKGQMTITMNISNNLIDTFLPQIAVGSGIRISNFSIKNKTQYERGDADCCIVLSAKSSIEIVPLVCKQQKLTPDLTISQIIHADCSYSVGSFGAIATSYHMNTSQLEVHVKDGDMQQDMATVVILNSNTEMCATLQQMFSTADMPLVLFKNVVRAGPKGTNVIHTTQSTFVQELNDQCTKAHLQTLTKSNVQVFGTLKAKNVHLPPYEICCSDCYRTLLSDLPIDVGSAYCTHCNKATQPSHRHNLLCTLYGQGGNIDCCLQGKLLQQHLPEIAEIEYEQYRVDISLAVFLLRRFQIHGKFTLAVNNCIVRIVKD